MFRKIMKFKLVSSLIFAALIFVSGGSLWAYLALRGTSGPLIIHFNGLVGINEIGGLRKLLGIGEIGAVVAVINLFVALELEERDRFWGKLLAAATLLFGILIFIGFAAIIGVN